MEKLFQKEIVCMDEQFTFERRAHYKISGYCCTGYTYGGERIANCAESPGMCRSTCAEHSGQNLKPQVERSVKSDRQRKSCQ